MSHPYQWSERFIGEPVDSVLGVLEYDTETGTTVFMVEAEDCEDSPVLVRLSGSI